MWISKTPLRVSFFGGGTDYPSYFRGNTGSVLGCTIDKYVFIQVLPLASFAEQRFRVTYRTTESVDRVEDIRHPVVREGLKFLEWKDPLNIATMSDLPGSSGLGSSSAFTVGFLNLLHCMRGEQLTKFELARQAIHVEHDILQERVGVQDQIHASFGGLSRYEFCGDSFSIEPLRVSSKRIDLMNRSMLLVYTGNTRSASSIVAEQEDRTSSGANADYLREMFEMTRVGSKILEDEGDDRSAIKRFCDLLDHGWNLKRQLSTSISSSTIDDIYSRGKQFGALGGKLLGAGGGGFILFFVEPERITDFSEEFADHGVTPIRMVHQGSSVERF